MADQDAPPEIGELLATGIAMIVLGQMRSLEDRVLDPSERWRLLRRAMETFVRAQRRDEGRGTRGE